MEIRRNEKLCEPLDGVDIVKYTNVRRLQLAGHVYRIDNTRIPKKSAQWKISWKRPTGRQRLKWEDIRRDSSLQLNIRGWWRLAEDSDIWGQTIDIWGQTIDIWGQTIEKSEPDVGCLPEKKKRTKRVSCKCHVTAPSL